jgi:phosphoribosylformimino-5-aminoimidazole carboxamide ribotide isomerase
MWIIGVIDLLGGRAVHAQGGCRLGYRPVDTVAGERIAGDAAVLSRVYVEQLGVRELYVADLDAIARGTGADDAVRAIAACGVPVWIDAGVRTVAQARRASAGGRLRVVVGLETLPSFAVLRDICVAGLSDPRGEPGMASPTAFSLDLRGGVPVAAAADLRAMTPEVLACRAVDAGAGAVIVLDLDRIGSGRGVDVELIQRLRKAAPGVTLLAGGGVRDRQDLERLEAVGCDAVLVGTALHTGTLLPASWFLIPPAS